MVLRNSTKYPPQPSLPGGDGYTDCGNVVSTVMNCVISMEHGVPQRFALLGLSDVLCSMSSAPESIEHREDLVGHDGRSTDRRSTWRWCICWISPVDRGRPRLGGL